LDAFAASEPLFDDLLAMADVIAKDYFADYRLRWMRSKDVTQRDGENENVLLLNKYMLLYEELSYAMNIGDIGQVLRSCSKVTDPKGFGLSSYAVPLS
jgi:hypothetical protein